MRFPCEDFTDNECEFDFAALWRCPRVNIPELSERGIDSITTTAFYGRYLCFDSSGGLETLKEMPFITELRQLDNSAIPGEPGDENDWNYPRFPEEEGTWNSAEKPLMEPNFPLRANATCNIDQKILFEFLL